MGQRFLHVGGSAFSELLNVSFSPSINCNCTALGKRSNRKSELEDNLPRDSQLEKFLYSKQEILNHEPKRLHLRSCSWIVRRSKLDISLCMSFDQSKHGFKFPLRHCVISLIYDPLSRLSSLRSIIWRRTKGSATGRYHYKGK